MPEENIAKTAYTSLREMIRKLEKKVDGYKTEAMILYEQWCDKLTKYSNEISELREIQIQNGIDWLETIEAQSKAITELKEKLDGEKSVEHVSDVEKGTAQQTDSAPSKIDEYRAKPIEERRKHYEHLMTKDGVPISSILEKIEISRSDLEKLLYGNLDERLQLRKKYSTGVDKKE